MIDGFVHEVVATLPPNGDERALGGAVTKELCGHWEHDGACRWEHHTDIVGRAGDTVTARIVFSCPPGEEAIVRERISRALQAEHLDGPEGPCLWRVDREGPV